MKNTVPRPLMLPMPSARIQRGLSHIRSEMATLADGVAMEGADGRKRAAEIREALAYIDAAIGRATWRE